MKWINFRDVDMPYPRTFVVDLGSGNVIKVPNLDSAIIKGLTRFFHGKPLVVEEYQRQKNGSYNRVKVHTFKTPDELPPKIRERYLKIRNKVNEDVYASSTSKRPVVTSKWSLIARHSPNGGSIISKRNNITGEETTKLTNYHPVKTELDKKNKKDSCIFDARLNNRDIELLKKIKNAQDKRRNEYIAPKYPYTKKKNASTSNMRYVSSNLQNGNYGIAYGGRDLLGKDDEYDKTLKERRHEEIVQQRKSQEQWEKRQGFIANQSLVGYSNKKQKPTYPPISVSEMKRELERRFHVFTGERGVKRAIEVYNEYRDLGVTKEDAFRRMANDIYGGKLKNLSKINDHAIRDFAVLSIVTALIPFVKSAMLSQVGGFIASRLFNKLIVVSMKPGTLTDNIVKEIKRDGNDLVRALKRNGNAAYRQIEMLINKI